MAIAISVIVTTYNWPQALELVVSSLCLQANAPSFEIIIADDGSKKDTKDLVQKLQQQFSSVKIIHVWQEDLGFRAAKIRNLAIQAASGTYLIFIDGDCIVPNDFIKEHFALKQSGYFVAGNRILLSKSFTKIILQHKLLFWNKSFIYFIVMRILGRCNRLLPLLKLPNFKWRIKNPKKWQGAKGCNLGVFKRDLLAIGGWDESFKGWGYEDSALVIKLINNQIYHKSGKFAAFVWHLWHLENSRVREAINWNKLQSMLK